jgi:ATP-dependent helicase HrpA
VQRNDFKLDMLAPHLFMNFRVVDEHGRQLASGRHLATLKAQWGAQARGAFQALAALKLPQSVAPAPAPTATDEGRGGRGVRADIVRAAPPPAAAQRHTDWTFGELPELLELPNPSRGGPTLIGFPALVDRGDAVQIEVFDEPDVAAARHRIGLRRLVALQLKEPLKHLEKNIPELQKMAAAYMGLGTMEELRTQIIDVALERSFLADPLPADARSFKARIDEGRTRLVLVAHVVARQAGTVLIEFAAAQRKLKDSRAPKDVVDDIAAQLQRLCPKTFLASTPWAQLQHLPRYLKAVQLRLDKQRSEPARDAERLAELRPLEQRHLRRLAELKGAADARLDEYRWLLEELRVSLFAQELRTPQPVSSKRLDKAWAQLSR